MYLALLCCLLETLLLLSIFNNGLKTVIKQHLQRALRRQISLQIGKKFMHLLVNDSLELPKFTSRGM